MHCLRFFFVVGNFYGSLSAVGRSVLRYTTLVQLGGWINGCSGAVGPLCSTRRRRGCDGDGDEILAAGQPSVGFVFSSLFFSEEMCMRPAFPRGGNHVGRSGPEKTAY